MIFRFLEYELDATRFELRRQGQKKRLPAERSSMDLLLYLIRNRDRIVSRQELLEQLWPGVVVRERVVDQSIYTVRKLLGDDARAPRAIETIRGRGWRFVAEVMETLQRPRSDGYWPPGEIPFVGRHAELGILEDAFSAAARAGRGSLVVVHGEPGSGKSRLLKELQARTRRFEGQFHLARCPAIAGAPSLWPWLQLLRSYREQASADVWRAQLEAFPAFKPQWSREADVLRDKPADAAAAFAAPPFQRTDELARFWIEVARAQGPLLLALDDLHRADEASLRLLDHLTPELGATGIVLVATLRRERQPTLAHYLRMGGVRSIELRGLDRAETREFIERSWARPPEAHEFLQIFERSAGNPHLLGQLTLQQGAVSPDGARLPQALREAIFEHLQAADEALVRLLRCGAVIGRQFDLERVAELNETPLGETATLLEQGLECKLLERPADAPEQVFRFVHGLLCEALYEALPAARRRALHAKVGRHLLQRASAAAPNWAEIARHLLRAGDEAERDAQREAALAAARQAFEGADFRRVVTVCKLALEVMQHSTTDDETAFEIQLLLARAEQRLGERVKSRAAFLEAAALARARSLNPEALLRVAQAAVPGVLTFQVGSYDEEHAQLLREALAHAGGRPEEAELVAKLATALHWAPSYARERAELAERVETLCAEDRTSRGSVAARVYASAASWSPDRRVEHADLLKLQQQTAQLELNDESLLVWMMRIANTLEYGRLDEAEALLAELEASVALRRVHHARWYAPAYHAMLSLERGDFQRARAEIAKIMRVAADSGDGNAQLVAISQSVVLQFHTGEDLDVFGKLDTAMRAAPLGARGWRYAKVRFQVRMGVAEAARAEIEKMVANVRTLPRDSFYLGNLCLLSEAAAGLRDPAHFAALWPLLCEFEERIASLWFGVNTWGAVARAAACLASAVGNWDAAERQFERAIELEMQSGARAWATHSRFAYHTMLLRRGRSRDLALAGTLLADAEREALLLGIVLQAPGVAPQSPGG